MAYTHNINRYAVAQFMTPRPKDSGPVQKIGNMGKEEIETTIDDMKERLATISPEIEYVGHGDDGCEFEIDGRNVIKLMFPVITWDAANEAYALQVLNEASSPIVPKLEDIGHIGPYRAIIREEVRDISGNTSEFKSGSVMNFLFHIPSEIKDITNQNPDVNVDEAIQQKIKDFVDTYYDGDPESKADEMERNPFLSPDFIKDFCVAHEILSNNDIAGVDISENDFGLGKTGDACLRNLSKLICLSVPEVDFSKDVTSKVLELVEGYKNRMAKTNEATKGLEPGL